MPIGALVLGILALVVFDWLGPVIGLAITAAIAAPAAIEGTFSIAVWPIWAFGLGIGVGLPFIPVVLGAMGMVKSADQKGIALCGLVSGAVGLLIGLVITAVLALGLDLTDKAVLTHRTAAQPASSPAEPSAPTP